MIARTRTARMTWHELARLSQAELEPIDTAVLNLACSAGFRGSLELDADYCLKKLDRWAEVVAETTERQSRHFLNNPERFNHSWAYFRALLLITVLERDLGLKYDPAKRHPDGTPGYYGPEDIFIHGALQGEGGTCASLPVIHVAVGCRLGYPMKLAEARGPHSHHYYSVWDEPAARFNIDASGHGLHCHPDEHYHTGRFWHPEQLRGLIHVAKPKTAKETLATFLRDRATQCHSLNEFNSAADAWSWAHVLSPDETVSIRSLGKEIDCWRAALAPRLPSSTGMPPINICFKERRFPDLLPATYEQQIAWCELVEKLLADPFLDRRWWRSMRKGVRTSRGIKDFAVEYTRTNTKVTLNLAPALK